MFRLVQTWQASRSFWIWQIWKPVNLIECLLDLCVFARHTSSIMIKEVISLSEENLSWTLGWPCVCRTRVHWYYWYFLRQDRSFISSSSQWCVLGQNVYKRSLSPLPFSSCLQFDLITLCFTGMYNVIHDMPYVGLELPSGGNEAAFGLFVTCTLLSSCST